MGSVELDVELGERDSQEHLTVRALFNIVDTRLAYNGVIGRPILWETNIATSIRYLVMKIPTQGWIITIRGYQNIAKQCYQLATKDEIEVFSIESNIEDEKQWVRPEPVEQLREIKLTNGVTIKIGSETLDQVKEKLEQVL